MFESASRFMVLFSVLALAIAACDFEASGRELLVTSKALSAKNSLTAASPKVKRPTKISLQPTLIQIEDGDEDDPFTEIQACVDSSDTAPQCMMCCIITFQDDLALQDLCVDECQDQCQDCEDPWQDIQDCVDSSENTAECSACCEAKFPDDPDLRAACIAECEQQCEDCEDPWQDIQDCLDSSFSAQECSDCCMASFPNDPDFRDFCIAECDDQCPPSTTSDSSDTCTQPSPFAKP